MQKYPFLRFAASVLRVVGWIVLVIGVIGSIGAIVFGVSMGGVQGVFVGIMGAVGGVILAFLSWLFLLATRELFYLFMHVEENTRNTAESIAKKSS